MADWIQEKSIAQASQDRETKEDARKKRAEVTALMDQLEAAVRRDVDKWNELNPGYRRRIDGVSKLMPSGAFQVVKTSFPTARLAVMLAPDGQAALIERSVIREGATRTLRDQLRITAEPDGAFQFVSPSGDTLDCDAASRALLEPIIEAIGTAR
jgi:hypothetical protein